DLPPLVVERVAIRIVRGAAEHADLAVVLEPAHLAVVRDVAEDEEASDAAPGGTFEEAAAGPQTADRVVRNDIRVERRIDAQHIGIGEVGRRLTEIARRVADDGRRRDTL